ncbi:MAG TPA: NAD(P)/FAD-dependent oxidoreductase [Steroidobacteraceae bacterium]|nr:NAD(P)/FAD-dependent oxidoreductase [Steroidobacteraceae bacterium]
MISREVTIVGAGLAGSLVATLLAQQGHAVQALEKLPDLRHTRIDAGRSINLALAARGIRALESAGIMPRVLPLLIPMKGRMVHAINGDLTFVPYGQREHEVIYSVSRPGLNRVLLDAAEEAGVQMRFSEPISRIQPGQIRSEAGAPIKASHVIGADGAGSVIRKFIANTSAIHADEALLEHGYKELTLPADRDGRHQLERNALHIWPRGGFMLIALPNLDGSFTVTLFLPHHGRESFEALRSEPDVRKFFAQYFPDVISAMPNLAAKFLEHPTGVMGTIYCDRWYIEDQFMLLGDAAHAITPFHGQGMNCAFEDCRVLSEMLLNRDDWSRAFAEFQIARKPETDAIAKMALENYLEMRDTVRDPKFLLQKSLALELERRFPERFVPRYSMVMFHDEIPYSTAYSRGTVQAHILAELTLEANVLGDVDFDHAKQLVEARLTPLQT